MNAPGFANNYLPNKKNAKKFHLLANINFTFCLPLILRKRKLFQEKFVAKEMHPTGQFALAKVHQNPIVIALGVVHATAWDNLFVCFTPNVTRNRRPHREKNV